MARTVGSAGDQTRRRILQAAAELFVEHGFAGTSIRDISERLGMTKGSLYYHFTSKEDLLVALLAPLFEAVDEFVAAARATGGVTAELVRRLVDVLDEHAPLFRSFAAHPMVDRAKLEERYQMPARFVELQQILGGGEDEAALLRGRCALGVIHAGVLAPRLKDCAEHQPRLSEVEKAFVVDAVMRVLSVNIPAQRGKVGHPA